MHVRYGLFFLVAALLARQQNRSSWQGEWGSYRESPVSGVLHTEGQRLSITSCLRDACQALIETSQLNGGRCGSSGELQIKDRNTGRLLLHAPKKDCELHLTITSDGGGRWIRVDSQTGNCRALCTGNCSFTRRFPFRSVTPFYGEDIPRCYLMHSKSSAAICADKNLADLEQSWHDLGGKERREQPNCDTAEDVPACLRAFFLNGIKGKRPSR